MMHIRLKIWECRLKEVANKVPQEVLITGAWVGLLGLVDGSRNLFSFDKGEHPC